MKKDTQKLRISVSRSNVRIAAQVIDDAKGVTLFSVSTAEIKEKKNPTQKAYSAGELLAKKIANQKIGELVFDRGSFRYHGRVKALAEGLRAGGVKI